MGRLGSWNPGSWLIILVHCSYLLLIPHNVIACLLGRDLNVHYYLLLELTTQCHVVVVHGVSWWWCIPLPCTVSCTCCVNAPVDSAHHWFMVVSGCSVGHQYSLVSTMLIGGVVGVVHATPLLLVVSCCSTSAHGTGIM